MRGQKHLLTQCRQAARPTWRSSALCRGSGEEKLRGGATAEDALGEAGTLPSKPTVASRSLLRGRRLIDREMGQVGAGQGRMLAAQQERKAAPGWGRANKTLRSWARLEPCFPLVDHRTRPGHGPESGGGARATRWSGFSKAPLPDLLPAAGPRQVGPGRLA